MMIGRHAPGEQLARHRHAAGYVALVLAGDYEEAGDTGRIGAAAGTVVVHHAWSAHRDRFGARGAQVLDLPLIDGLGEGAGSVADPDMIVRLAGRDVFAAAEALREAFVPAPCAPGDWPDLLALRLAQDDMPPLARWADGMHLDPASVSRGFARVYGVSPKRYRLELRTRRALLALSGWPGSLAALAAEHGFADQAHFARAARVLTGLSPSQLRTGR